MRFSSFSFLLLFCLMISCYNIKAQDIVRSLEEKKVGEGTITIHQDARIRDLIGSVNTPADNTTTTGTDNGTTSTTGNSTGKKVFKTSGYRVQVYAGNNTRQGKDEALKKASQVKGFLIGTPVYTYFQPPRWLCRVGDFKSIEEADAVMRRLKANPLFKEVSIVRDQINIIL